MATILVVDDLAANREFLVTLLRYKGHRLLEAANGRDALEAAGAERPDLIITDVLMPVMDGYEFIRELRLDSATRDIPVVFCTAHYGEREARDLALSSGVAYVLTKPAEAEEVLRVVDLALAGAPAMAHPHGTPLRPEFDREHLRLVTDKLSEKTENLQAANVRLRALVNIGLELASDRDADHLLQSVCTSARELFGATYVALGIFEGDERSLGRVVVSGANGMPVITPHDQTPELLAATVRDRRTIRGVNPDGDPVLLGFPVGHRPIRAFLIAPIVSPARVYGWICLVNNDEVPFTDEDEQLAMALSGQVGRIYENGYFYRIAQTRAEALEREVGERERAEWDLRRERDRAQRYLDTAEVILLALDLDGRITQINRYACAMLGWSAAELLGRDWVETCLPVRIRPALREKFRNLIASDLSIVENPVLTRSGDERMIEWRNTALRDEAGRVTGTFSSGTDITERNYAARALQLTEERMRFALEAAKIGIWDLDYNTGVLRWSERLEQQYGFSPGTFPGTFEAFIARVHPEDRDTVAQTVAQANRSGTDFVVTNRAVSPDGTVRWMAGAGRVHLGPNGDPVRGIGISMDVTERRTLEEQYQQAQKMEAIGRLAGGVAHDFNNLLTAILGYCDLLLADLREDDPRSADISEIQKAGLQAARLTRQLLAFSRKQIIEPVHLDVNEIVTDTRSMLGRLIGEDIKIVLRLAPTDVPVKIDRGQLEQVVMNLAVNARDAMPMGGTLIIETAMVWLDDDYAKTHLAVPPGSYVVLTMTDSGSGMTSEVQARLFEPFFTTKEPGKGTGLGLATVHGIVKQGSGTISVYSEVGKGTSFKIYFPMAEPSDELVEAPRPAVGVRKGSRTVLVVEDSEGLRELTRRLLAKLGYTVLIASNADEAREQFARHADIDVMLTDVVMPGASGPELARQLADERPGLKVIYMSGYTEEAIVQHGVLKPGIAFIHKPFTSETLGRKVSEVLEA